MRLSLLVALSLALCAQAAAQATPAAPATPAGDTGVAPSSTGEPRGSLSVVERPSDMVARLARTVLLAPGESSAWRALAGALPELALEGPADLEGTLEAARLADSVAATLQARSGEPDTLPPDTASMAPASPATPRRSLLWPGLLMGAGALLLGALGMGELRRRWARASRGGRRVEEAGRLWTVRTLAGSGIPLAEIARRTGMAQEAVDLALSLAGAPLADTAQGRRARPGRPSAEARRDRDDRLRLSLDAGVSALTDGRLTYGGGVSR